MKGRKGLRGSGNEWEERTEGSIGLWGAGNEGEERTEGIRE